MRSLSFLVATLAVLAASLPAQAQSRVMSVSELIARMDSSEGPKVPPYIAQYHGAGAIGELKSNLLKQEKPIVRQRIAESLGLIGEKAASAAPELITSALSGNSAATDAIGKIGAGCLPALLQALPKQKEPTERLLLLKMIGNFGPKAQPGVGTLSALLAKDPDAGVRARCAEILGVIGAGASSASGALVTAMSDEDGKVVDQAGAALIKIGDGAVSAISKMLREKEEVVRQKGVALLGAMSITGKKGASALKSAFADKEASIRKQAATAMAAYGKDSTVALNELINLLKDEDAEVIAATQATLQALRNSDLSKSDLAKIAQALGE